MLIGDGLAVKRGHSAEKMNEERKKKRGRASNEWARLYILSRPSMCNGL
jgi:hypothetical protein